MINNNSATYINASSWPSITIGLRQFFSPDAKLLAKIAQQPDAEFWYTTYTEFACVIIDNNDATINVVRDHFGLEPLFYHLNNGNFIFGSNIPDIIHKLAVIPELNSSQIVQLLLKSCMPAVVHYSDETNYKHIYRVEPGTKLRIKDDKIYKSVYWHIPTSEIIYTNPQEYLEHFNELLIEGIKLQIDGQDKFAAEFSGGLDSSTVVTGLHKLNIDPSLFMHIAPEGSNEIDDSRLAYEVIRYYQLSDVHTIDAQDFDLLSVLELTSQLFAGTPNFIFPICANNIHSAVAKAGHKVLFSGFGGDECVSSHAPLPICLYEYLKANNYSQAWHELNAYYTCNNRRKPSQLRLCFVILKKAYPQLFINLQAIPELYKTWQLSRQGIVIDNYLARDLTVRDYECNLLKGMNSYHVRLRVEESAIVAKHFGFSYKYPLLYPKLVEFCHRLPLALKRENGENRLLVRNYLAQYLPPSVYQKHQKIGGIMPATMHKLEQGHTNGRYNELFSDLPFQNQALAIKRQSKSPDATEIRHKLLLCGLKIFSRS